MATFHLWVLIRQVINLLQLILELEVSSIVLVIMTLLFY